MNCKNCGQIVEGNYCSNCGQKTSVVRLTFSTLVKELSESIFQVNRGFFYTFKELLLRPGEGIKDYLDGKRKRHFKPIAYLLLLSTLYFLVTQVSGQNTWMDDIITGFTLGALDKGDSLQMPPVITWLSKNYAYTTLLLLPVFTLASYFSFRKYGINYVEHFVLNSYITGQQAVAYSILALIQTFVAYKPLEALPLFISLSYAFWVFAKFFKTGHKLNIFLRSILTYAIYMILSGGILTVILGIIEIVN